MKCFLSLATTGALLIQVRAEGEGIIGDLTATVTPGHSFMGHDYAALVALGNGEHDISAREAQQ